MKNKVVIVGGNRGIGLELVKQYQKRGDEVIVLCRRPSTELEGLKVKTIPDIDVKDDNIINTLASNIPWEKIDIFIHNAGILKGDQFPEISLDSMRESFEVNTLGPLKTTMALKEKFSSGTKIGIVSSRVGSIADNSSSNNYAYRTSKTAVNMIGSCLALDFKKQGVSLAMLHPGYVRTDMTRGSGLIDADESAMGLIKRMDELTLNTSGIFVHTSGEVLPW